MGSFWSSESSSPSSDSLRNENGKRPRSNDDNAAAEAAAESSQDRKAKRQRTVTAASFSASRPLHFFKFGYSYVSNKVTVWLANAFLSFAEYTANKSSAPSCRELMEDEEFMESMCHVLDCFQASDPEIMTRGWKMLCACAMIRDSDASGFPESDVACVITGMNLHEESMRLQLLGCRALRILLTKERTTWQHLVDNGIIPVLLQAMTKFPQDLILQGLMTTMLGMLIKETGDDCRSQLVHNGAVERILEAMQHFSEEERLLYTGCYSLHQLSCHAPARAKILETGGALVLVNMLQKNVWDRELVDIGLHALCRLTTVDASELDTWQWTSSDQLIPTILNCMQEHPFEKSIQSQSLVCILRLVGHVSVPPQRSIHVILASMKNFAECPNFLFFACATLQELVDQSPHDSALSYWTSEHGIDSILNVVRDHPTALGLRSIVIVLLSEILTYQQQTDATPRAFGGGQHAVAVIGGLEVRMAGPPRGGGG